MNDHSDQRDKIIARLAGQSLRARTQVTSACPDPELVAAYADRSLTAAEAQGCETHFAACPECQKLLALLAVSAEPPLAQQQAEAQSKTPVSFPKNSGVAAKQSPAQPSGQHKTGQAKKLWLVAALGVAAVLTLWLAFRPAVTPTQTAAVAPSAAPAAPPSNSPGANTPPQNEIAQAEIPPPLAGAAPALKPREPSLASDRESSRESDQKDVQTAKALPRALAADQTASAPVGATGGAPAEQSAAVRGPFDYAGSKAAAPAVSALPRPALPSATAPNATTPNAATPNATTLEALTATAGSPELQTERTTPSTNATSAARAGNRVAGLGAGSAPSPSSLPDQTVAGLAKEVAPGASFAAGDGPMWRVGPEGHVERSNDKGATWRPQSSGVKSDLLAGTAVSAQVAWVVGREGVILRTTDGMTWQRIASPNRLMVDWTSIQATDANHASIKSSDDRSFRTENGGHTWVAQ